MDEDLMREIQEENERRPRYCGGCTWRDCRGVCAHGAGPRSGESVGLEELSCGYGKGMGAFTEDPDYLDGDESWDRTKEAKDREQDEKIYMPMLAEIDRWGRDRGWEDHRVRKGVWKRRGRIFRRVK